MQIQSPFEKLRKSFRNCQVHLEKDLNLIKCGLDNNLNSDEIDKLIFKAKSLKAKVSKGGFNTDIAYTEL